MVEQRPSKPQVAGSSPVARSLRLGEFEAIIGLEIHVQLSTKTKLFCGCKVEFGKEPNTNVCPVCLGLPGSLPVLNKRAVELALRASLALNCKINETSIFARKNYFYPDLPKGYQISQYERPLAVGGYLEFEVEDGKTKRVRIRRIHLEEDAGKNIHEGNKTLVDLNRAGTPLIEIVTEPDINSPLEARLFLENLRNLLRYAGVSNADMEKGQLRCDINVSVRRKGEGKFGTRTEIKNVNSFRFVQKALEYEIQRQVRIIKEGGKVEQETRGFDPQTGKTFTMRRKEEAEDYRYFPEPDLLPLVIDKEFLSYVKENIPELPSQRLERYLRDYSLPKKEAKILVNYKELGDYFEEALNYYREPKKLLNWLINDLLGNLKEKGLSIENSPVRPKDLTQLLKLVDGGQISTKIAKEVLREALETGKKPTDIIEERGLKQISDENLLRELVEEVIKENGEAFERLKNGEKRLMGFFVGQIMKKTKGKANPRLVSALIEERLKNS